MLNLNDEICGREIQIGIRIILGAVLLSSNWTMGLLNPSQYHKNHFKCNPYRLSITFGPRKLPVFLIS
jgi:hypothetical protein